VTTAASWPTYYGGRRNFVYSRPKVKPPIPLPEVYARPAKLEEMGRDAKTLGKRLRDAGWEIRITYARGPWLSSDGEDVLSIADSILVVGRRSHVWLAACWIHRDDSVKEGKPAGAWKRVSCHVRDPFPASPRAVTWETLMAYLEVSDG
jgi:hypothetical protein